MRKRILCISALSLLLVGMFAAAASATTYYCYSNFVATPTTTKLVADGYKEEYTISVSIDVYYNYDAVVTKKTDIPTTSVYVTKATPFTFTVNPSEFKAADTSSLLTSNSTGTGKKRTGAVKGTLTTSGGEAKIQTITVQPAFNGTNIGSPIEITVEIPSLEAPKFTGDLTAWTTGQAIKDGQKITIANAKSVTVTSSDYYGIKYAVAYKDAKGKDTSKPDDTATATVTFTGTPQGATTGTPITITAENGRGSTSKEYKLKIKGVPPSEAAFTTQPSIGTGSSKKNTTVLGAAYNASEKKPIVKGGVALDATKLVFEFGTTSTKTDDAGKKVTTPLIITADGLPPGLVLVQETGDKTSAASGTAKAHIEGTPTTAGKYTVKIKAKNDASAEDANGNLISTTYSKDFTMDVLFLPEIKTDSLSTITWGKAYSDKISVTGGIDAYPIGSFDIYDGTNGTGTSSFKKVPSTNSTLPSSRAAKTTDTTTTTAKYTNPPLPDGLTLTLTTDKKTGEAVGTLAGKFNGADGDKFSFDKEGEKTIKLRVVAGNALTAQEGYKMGVISKDVEVTLKAVRPTILKTDILQNELTKKKLKYHGNQLGGITEGFIVSADGPGTMSWTVENLPAGLAISQDQTKDTTKRRLRIYGSPDVTVKNHSTRLTITNGAGSVGYTIKFDIGADSVDITTKNHPVGPASVDTYIDKVFEAEPGPIVWKAKNLPSGLKLSIDKSVSFDQKVHLVGTLKGATVIDKKYQSVYTITAANKIINKSVVTSNDFKVYSKQKITTSSLPKMTLDKAYTAKINGSGSTVSKDYTWDIKFRAGEKGTPTSGTFNTGGKSSLSVKYDAKTNMPTITGSLDRFPKSGDKIVPIIVTVTLTTPANTPVSKEFEIATTGIAPKFTTAKIADFTSGKEGSADVKVSGTKPLYMRAYIPKAAAKTHLSLDKEVVLVSKDTDANKAAITEAGGFWFEPSTDGKGVLHFKALTTGNYAFSGIPIMFAVSNDASAKDKNGVVKETTKSFGVNVKTKGIQMVDSSDATARIASSDVTIFVPAATAMTPYILRVSGDKPYKVTVTPTKTTNGLTANATSEGVVTISGTPIYDKAKSGQESITESKTTFTITATNPSTKKKAVYKATVIGQAKPQITSTAKAREKEVEVGKNINIKLTAKGSKRAFSKGKNPISLQNKKWDTKNITYQDIAWKLSGDTTPLTKLGLSFDAKTGTIKGTAGTTTSDDNKLYSPITVCVVATNDAGNNVDADTGNVKIGVKGRKFKINTKTIAIYKGSEHLDSPDMMLKSSILSTDATSNVRWAWVGTNYSNYGFTNINQSSPNGYMGQLTGAFTSIPANKSISLKISADNVGQITTGTVKFSIYDAKPSIKDPGTLEMQAEKDIAATETFTFTLDNEPTGDTKIKWSLVGKPSNSQLTATLKQSGNNANVTMKLAKNAAASDTTWFRISAENTNTKQFEIKSFDVTIRAATDSTELPEDESALPEENETLTDDEELSLGEGTVTYGNARTESSLTQAERRALAEGGYIIAAILPEITADESGLYELDVVSLDEAAPVDSELVWFAFPRNAEESEDDTIAEFYDEAGAEIFAVPEGRKVVPAPWLEADVTYAPVIAVKAPVAGGAKDSLDDAEEGDTVTEKAIEEATAE